MCVAHCPIIAIIKSGNRNNYPAEVVFRIYQENFKSYLEAAAFINTSPFDIVSIQHEFGIFGGKYGEYIIPFLRHIRKPIITTLHGLPPLPSPKVRQIVRDIYQCSDAVVIMAKTGTKILKENYGIKGDKLYVIPHGVPVIEMGHLEKAKSRLGLGGRYVITTFGLIRPNKGIEYAIEALLYLIEKYPQIIYLVLGQTHPEWYDYIGESYRNFLKLKVLQFRLGQHVSFAERYLDEELNIYLQATDIYINPYISFYKITSGTLAYALGYGKAIISTPYPYAREVLAEGRGILVPYRDSLAIAQAIDSILSDPQYKHELEQAAYTFGRTMQWPKVAKAYLDLFLMISRRNEENNRCDNELEYD
jgi:glycosyltransferase involved in cell wall biosynthesis